MNRDYRKIAIVLALAAIHGLSHAADAVQRPLTQLGAENNQAKCTAVRHSHEAIALVTQTGDLLCLPRNYLRRNDPVNATATAIWVEASFPDASPLWTTGGADAGRTPAFLAPGNVSIVYRFGIPQGLRWLNRVVGEQTSADETRAVPRGDDPLPDNTLEKRLRKSNIIEGLTSYLIDPDRIIRHLAKTHRNPHDPHAYSSFEDWHLRRSSFGEVVTLIRCTAELTPPSGTTMGGAARHAPPVPLCTHLAFTGKQRDRDIEIRYRKTMLSNWMEIETMASTLIDKFSATN